VAELCILCTYGPPWLLPSSCAVSFCGVGGWACGDRWLWAAWALLLRPPCGVFSRVCPALLLLFVTCVVWCTDTPLLVCQTQAVVASWADGACCLGSPKPLAAWGQPVALQPCL
jgi:hypothetical protein